MAPNVQFISRNILCFLFYAFGAVISLRVIPTGFISTFYWLFIIFCCIALIFSRQLKREINLDRENIIGLFLFLWIFVSIFWSNQNFLVSLSALSEYRIFIIVPLAMSVIYFIRPSVQNFLGFFTCALAVGLILSILSSIDLFGFTNHIKMRTSHIPNGFLSTVLLSILLSDISVTFRRFPVIRYTLIGLILWHVFFIEEGRSGHLQAIAVLIVFSYFRSSAIKKMAGFILSFLLVVSAFNYSDTFRLAWLDLTQNTSVYVSTGDTQSRSEGQRLEFYKSVLGIIEDSPLVGVGVGDAEDALRNFYASGKSVELTDNVHSEYFNQLLIGGAIGLLLFLTWMVLFLQNGLSLLKFTYSFNLGIFILLTGSSYSVGMLFNSAVKDFGEKNLLTVVLIIIFWLRNEVMTANRKTEAGARG